MHRPTKTHASSGISTHDPGFQGAKTVATSDSAVTVVGAFCVYLHLIFMTVFLENLPAYAPFRSKISSYFDSEFY
jgi:hypothetical protein